MSAKAAVISFENGHFTVYAEGRLLLSVPSVVIRKKSASPVGVCYGNEAYRRRDDLPEGQAFFHAFNGDMVADPLSARLLIKYCLQSLFAYDHTIELFIILSSGPATVGLERTEEAFIEAGYKNIYFIERPYLLAKIAEKRGFPIVVNYNDRTVEVVRSVKGEPAEAHSVNIGFDDVAEKVCDWVCAKHELSACLEPTPRSGERSFVLNVYGEFPVFNCCSLSKTDYTPLIAIGLDIISGRVKKVPFPAKEIYHIVSQPYEKAFMLLTAVLMGCDEETVRTVGKRGVLHIGKPTAITGFTEFMYGKNDQLPVHIDSDPFTEVRELYDLIDDKAFIDRALGFHK